MTDPLDPYPGNLKIHKVEEPSALSLRMDAMSYLTRVTMEANEKLKHDRMRYRETISTLKAVLKKHGLWEEAVEAMKAQNNFDPPLDK